MAEKRILVVDDDQDTCSNLAGILRDLDFHVDVAHRGWGAVELAQQQKYLLALLDYKLPCMTGVELYDHLKRLQPDAEGVLITGYASAETEQRAKEAGLRRVLPKPVDIGVLVALVREIAGRREMTAAVSESEALALFARYNENVKLLRQSTGSYRVAQADDESWHFLLVLGELLLALCYIAPESPVRIREDYPWFSHYIRDRK